MRRETLGKWNKTLVKQYLQIEKDSFFLKKGNDHHFVTESIMAGHFPNRKLFFYRLLCHSMWAKALKKVSNAICKHFLTTDFLTQVRNKTDSLTADVFYSRSRLLSDSGSEKALLDWASMPPFTLSRRERTLFCWFLAKRARRIFHIAVSLRLATLVRTAVIAVKETRIAKLTWSTVKL